MENHLYKVGDKVVVRTPQALVDAGVNPIVRLKYRRDEVEVFAGMEITISSVVKGKGVPWYNVEEDMTETSGLWHQDFFVPVGGEKELEPVAIQKLKSAFIGHTIVAATDRSLTLDDNHWHMIPNSIGDGFTYLNLKKTSWAIGSVIGGIRYKQAEQSESRLDVEFIDADGALLLCLYAKALVTDDVSFAAVTLGGKDDNEIILAAAN